MNLKKHSIVTILFIFGFLNIYAQGSYNQLVYEGNRSFNHKNYDKSSMKFEEATKLDNKDFTAVYNLGNTFYKKKMYKEAQTEYQKAEKLAKTKPDKTAALYNLGNAYMQSQEPEKAAEQYKLALKQDPYNAEIRKNYEIAKLKQQEKEKKQQEDQQKENQKNKGKEDQKKDNQGDQQKGQNPKQDNGNQQNNQQGKGGKDENKKESPKPDDNAKLPKELEQAILNRMDNKEKETARRILNKNSFSMPQSKEKDW